jgi:hypothetical protein
MAVDVLDQIGSAFVAHYERSGDLRYLNAVLKIVTREGFTQTSPAQHRRLSEWADRELDALRKSRGLA